MAPSRRRGGWRGGGVRGIGIGGARERGRGRGRGRGGSRYNTARLANDQDDCIVCINADCSSEVGGQFAMDKGRSAEHLGQEDETSDDDDKEEEEDDDNFAPPSRTYLELMRTLTESQPPKTKRRKMDHYASGEKETSRSEAPARAAKRGALGPAPHAETENARREEEAEGEDVDHVDEAEEDPAETELQVSLIDEEEEAETADPFRTHFVAPDEKMLALRLRAIQENAWELKRVAADRSRVFWSVPKTGESAQMAMPRSVTGPNDLKLKKKLHETMVSKRPRFDAVEQAVAPLVFNYHDLLYCERTVDRADSLRRMAVLHALNHIFKTRDRVVKNNERLSHAKEDENLELRDQGFTRPKILMILPTRQSCAKMVEMMCTIFKGEQLENRKRFDDAYVDKEQRFSLDKPADFLDLFSGNDDDNFRIGLKFTRKTIKFYAQFYNSDIIFGSPLGLRMAMGFEGEKDKRRKTDFDFLSSIEIVVIDQADALLMQNWEHVQHIFEHLNMQPRDAHGCDFSRVRTWYLEDQARTFRQTLVLSAFLTPELSELMRAHCRNWAGQARVQLLEYPGLVHKITVSIAAGGRVRQTFSRFDSPSAQADPDARFAYFRRAVIPMLTKRPKDAVGTLIFIPSYLDFVRVRNYFAGDSSVETLTFGTLSEYATAPDASRARSHFANGRHRLLLYTERAHHFRRYRIRGVRRVIMYGLPDNPLFYQEVVGGYLRASEQAFMLEAGQASVRVIFSKYDAIKLERIVGTQRVEKMVKERGDTFEFV